MFKKVLLLGLLLSSLLLSGCYAQERLSENLWINELHATQVFDDTVDYGIATVLAGDTYVIVNHSLGTVPTNVQLTLLGNPGVPLTYSVKNPNAAFFGIEIDAILGSDQRIYWWAKGK